MLLLIVITVSIGPPLIMKLVDRFRMLSRKPPILPNNLRSGSSLGAAAGVAATNTELQPTHAWAETPVVPLTPITVPFEGKMTKEGTNA